MSNRLLQILFIAPWLWSVAAFGQTVAPEMLATTVRTHLQEALDHMQQGFTLLEVQPRAALQLPDGELTMELALTPEELAPGARLQIPVTLLVNGKAEAETQVTVRLKQRVGLVIPRQTLHKGEMITASMLAVRETELTTPQGDLVTGDKLGQLVGKAANRQIREGQPIRGDWFDEPFVVGRGEKIRVVIHEKGLTIETLAVAEANGKVGEVIQVRNTKSNRRFPVRLTGPGEGRVEIL